MQDYYLGKKGDVFKEFDSSIDGIKNEDVKKRIEKYGYNEIIEQKKKSPFVLFLEQFKSFIVLILIAATIISLFLKEIVDAVVIIIILIFNAVFGFIQEYKAEKSIEALKKLTSLTAIVIRNGKEQKIFSRDLVPGDIILVKEGDKISADCRILEAYNLETQEASLTGESLPVSKEDIEINNKIEIAEQKNMICSGTIVTKGRGKAIVIGTGKNTYIGKIAKLIEESGEEQTPLQLRLGKLGKFLGISALIICAFIFIFQAFLSKDILDSFIIAVSLAVAAVPEGLPAVVTITLALGVRRMVKKNALVRKLSSVETLGSTNVICSDKTGTLTKNEMTVKEIYVDNELIEVTGSGYLAEGKFLVDGKEYSNDRLSLILKTGILCNDAKIVYEENKWDVLGDPTEGALIASAKKYGIDKEQLDKKNKRVDEIPFSSERKLMSTINIIDDNKVMFVKGAVDVLVNKCTKINDRGRIRAINARDKERILKTNEEMANKALRVLGFAYKPFDKKEESDLIFVGMQGMIDPAREEVKEAIKKCNEAGIKVVMITGDHKNTAVAIAKEIGLNGKALEGKDLDNISDKELVLKVEDYDVYARVNPEHKFRIVEALRKRGRIVAVTGDGVNDAPALKKADIGIAMEITGTDVAKEASDMVLVDDNFATIVNAVEEGRDIYSNIQKFVNFILSTNIAEILIIFLAIIFIKDGNGVVVLPLLAIQLLWINLVTDGLPALAIAVDKGEKDVMKKKPRKKDEHIITKKLGILIMILTILATVGVLFLFESNLQDLVQARTVAFTALVFFEMAILFVVRSEYKVKLFSNGWLWLAVLSTIGLQLLVVYSPLNVFFKTKALDLMHFVYIVISTLIIYFVGRIFVLISRRLNFD